jgi:4-amino-4-deoxy-L-arabinose transferase-like glycosyltransferase
VITAVALLVRVLLILARGTFHLPHDFSFAFEVGSVARSVAEGQGFSSPFGAPTGPTAIASPIYVYLLAGIFRVFGVYTDASALTAILLDALCSSLTCYSIFILARETFDQRIAVLAAWLWAFSPSAIHASTTYIWETCVSTLLLSLALILTLRLPSSTRIGDWLRYGALWGLLALTNGAALAVIPLLMLWVWLRSKRRTLPYFGRMVMAGLMCVLCISPWVIRNTVAFGTPIFRSGLVPEFYGRKLMKEELQDSQDRFPRLQHPRELNLYRELGEIEWVAARRHESIQLISASPLGFLRVSLTRALLYWFGDPYRFQSAGRTALLSLAVFACIAVFGFLGLFLAWRRRVTYASFYAIPLLTFSFVYYISHVEARYRHPVEPYLIILTAYAIATAFGRRAIPETPVMCAEHGAPANLSIVPGVCDASYKASDSPLVDSDWRLPN